MRSILKCLYLSLALACIAIAQGQAQDIWASVKTGNLGEVKEFLSKDPALLNQKNTEFLTPLNLAAEQGQTELAAFLLEQGADPLVGDRENSQPIHLAAISGSISIVDMLLAKGVKVDSRDLNLMTPLMFAASRGQLEMTAHLLEKGADAKAGNISGMGVMHYAAISGNVDLLKTVMKKGGQPNARTDEGFVPLHLAASYGRTDVVKYLAENGADIDAVAEDGAQPLAWAVGRNSYDAAGYLLSKGADVGHRDKDGFTALHDAVGRGNIRVTELLIDNGADLNSAAVNGFVPLSYAAWPENAAEIGQFLILRGAEVNPDPCKNNKACTCGPNFQTPLHHACQMGKVELAKILIDNGAKVNLFNADGQTPLHCAVKSGKPEIVKLLVDNGAFLNVAEKGQGCTELHFAAAMGYGDIAACLTGHGSCPEAKDKDGRTPVDYAFYYGQNQVGYELLAAGGDDSHLSGYLTSECPLKQQPAKGEAMVWFLGHSGWAIKTSDHFLVFDYFDDPRARKADHPCLSSGCLKMEDLKDQNLTVFSTHSHQDHFNPSIFSWKEANPGIEYLLCFQPDGIGDGYTYLPVNTETAVDDMNIYSIKSTDGGGGFLVEVDGLIIFHMGDHANGADGLAPEFTREIDLVAAKGKQIDIMFGPIRGCSLGTPEQVKTGTKYALEKLHPELFVPMHSGSYTLEYRKFVRQAAEDGMDQTMKYVVNKGDRFHYVKGEPMVVN
jgi:ankyrin repeat protein